MIEGATLTLPFSESLEVSALTENSAYEGMITSP